MADITGFTEFLDFFNSSLTKQDFVQITISNKRDKNTEIKRILAKPVLLKSGQHLSFNLRHQTKDITKNFSLEESRNIIQKYIQETYYQAELITLDYTYFLTIFTNGNTKLRHKINQDKKVVKTTHDHVKQRLIPAENNIYLQKLGVTTHEFKVKNKRQDKFKQINKYVEIIEDILKKTKLPTNPSIVDMGSGKGYLTFALYDYFTRVRGDEPTIHGIEIRPDLVELCNNISDDCSFKNLHFIKESIQESSIEKIDFLLALHACDTATDDAIHKGILGKSQLIVCAPCCHKQVRKNMSTTGTLENITKHGILQERQAEILTDTIRSMILEAFGYKTRVFEFISTVHTPKNVLIVASLNEERSTAKENIVQEIQALKKLYGISYQHLEKLMGIYQEK